MKTDFHSEKTFRKAFQVSISLVRVLQEALQNAVKHSGSGNIQVLLNDGSDAIQLTVTDSGRSFDSKEALRRQGIGLASIRERLKLVKGQLSIQIALGQGTTISVQVPLNPRTKSAGAGSMH